MTKAHLPLKVSKCIKLPRAPEVTTVIDGTGKHHAECDLCGIDITLTITANPRSFQRHQGGEACLKLHRSQGLPDTEPTTRPTLQILVVPPTGPSEQLSIIPCPGVAIAWHPGSIWETYPYHQHEIQAVGWRPVAFGNENNKIFLRSDRCFGFILDIDEPPCKECWQIEYSNKFQEFVR